MLVARRNLGWLVAHGRLVDPCGSQAPEVPPLRLLITQSLALALARALLVADEATPERVMASADGSRRSAAGSSQARFLPAAVAHQRPPMLPVSGRGVAMGSA